MNAYEINDVLTYSKEIALGFSFFLLVISAHIALASQISLHGSYASKRYLKDGKPVRVYLILFLLILALASSHFFAIALWGTLLRLSDVTPALIDSLIFSGSCYTTLGFIPDSLPKGWRMMPLFIAISGLFSFSISTAVVLSKNGVLKQAWAAKNQKRIEWLIKRYGLGPEDIDG